MSQAYNQLQSLRKLLYLKSWQFTLQPTCKSVLAYELDRVNIQLLAPPLHQNILHSLKAVSLYTSFGCHRRNPFTEHHSMFRTLQLVIHIPSLGSLFLSSLTFYTSVHPLRPPGSKSENSEHRSSSQKQQEQQHHQPV